MKLLQMCSRFHTLSRFLQLALLPVLNFLLCGHRSRYDRRSDSVGSELSRGVQPIFLSTSTA